MITACHHRLSLFACQVCSVIHHTSYWFISFVIDSDFFVCSGYRWRRRLWWSIVSRVCLWGVYPRSPVSAPLKWSCAVKGWWSNAPPSCRASTSASLTSTQSCRTGTCVSPGTGRAELERHLPSFTLSNVEKKCFSSLMLFRQQIHILTILFVRFQEVTTDVISVSSQGKHLLSGSFKLTSVCSSNKKHFISCWKS